MVEESRTFRKSFADINVISLTATPPYEGEPALWERYVAMCGEIDEEITVPELVKEGQFVSAPGLCVFLFPNEGRRETTRSVFYAEESLLKNLSSDSMFCEAVRTSRALDGTISEDELLNEPKYLSATLIFLRHKGIEFPKHFQQLLGQAAFRRLTWRGLKSSYKECYLMYHIGMIYPKKTCKELKHELKSLGLIDRKQVQLRRNKTTRPAIESNLLEN